MIAILTPYGRNEITFAALRLADLASALGHRCTVIACGVNERGVHEGWDARVRSCSCDRFGAALGRATQVVHFGAHRAWLEGAEEAAERAKNTRQEQILVPDWHATTTGDAAVVRRFDAVVFPTDACAHGLAAGLTRREGFHGPTAKLIPWAASASAVRREGTVEAGRMAICVVCDHTVIDGCGSLFIELLRILLTDYFDLRFTVLSTKSWARRDHLALRSLGRAHPGRLTCRRLETATLLRETFLGHDWAMFPALRANFGFWAIEAMAGGCAVLAHDLPPFDEAIRGGGFLVPCGIRLAGLLSPVAMPRLEDWLDVCKSAFGDWRTLPEIQIAEWGLDARRETFVAGWQEIFTD